MNSDFSGSERPLVAGFMRGYRAWQPGSGGRLDSSSAFYTWKPERNVVHCETIRYSLEELAQWDRISQNRCLCAGCGSYDEQLYYARRRLERLQAHQMPSDDPDCKTCGFYALHNVRRLREAVAQDMYIVPGAIVYGSIKATGIVIVGTQGFRAQYAEVEALAGPAAEPYAEHYGVPWFPEGLQSLVESFPATTVEGADEPMASGCWQHPHFTWVGTAISASPPITGLAPSPNPVEPDRDVPDPEPVADPVPMDPDTENWFRRWLNPRVWRRG